MAATDFTVQSTLSNTASNTVSAVTYTTTSDSTNWGQGDNSWYYVENPWQSGDANSDTDLTDPGQYLANQYIYRYAQYELPSSFPMPPKPKTIMDELDAEIDRYRIKL